MLCWKHGKTLITVFKKSVNLIFLGLKIFFLKKQPSRPALFKKIIITIILVNFYFAWVIDWKQTVFILSYLPIDFYL